MAQKLTDAELIAGCRAGKQAAQSALYQQYGRRLMSICNRYLTNAMEAEDAFHEAFMKVYNNISNYQGGSLEGWMRRIFVNTCINYYHKGKNRYLLEDIVEKDYLVADFPDVLSKMSADHIYKLIDELPTGARVVFNLFVIEGYSHKEIAEMLKLSEGTTKSQLNRAKELLREKLLVTA